MTRALLVYQDALLPSSRIRIIEMAPHLQRAGIACEVAPYPDTFAEKMSMMRRFSEVSVVVLQKKLPAFFDARWLSRAPRLVFDFDDAIMFRDREKGGTFESRTRRTRFERIAGMSHALIAGNEYLANQIAHRQILVSPSPVPHEVPTRDHREPERLRIGWVGLGKNLSNLESIADALVRCADRIELIVISDERFELNGVTVTNIAWSKDTQEAEIAKLDAGIMPLAADTPFTRGKCAYKLLQYMAASVPCIASPVGMNKTLIRHGANGLLASSSSEWIEAIDALGSVDKRSSLGAAGRATVLAEYTYPIQAERWARFLTALDHHD